MRRLMGMALAGILASAGPVLAGAVITNGSGIYLGVNDEGHLNFTDGVTTTLNGGGGTVGVAINVPGGFPVANRTGVPAGTSGLYDATSPACLCEGWGVAVNGLTSGYANISSDGGAVNLTVNSFASTASTATSTVSLTSLPGLTVTQAYAPSSSAALYENTVTITNNTGAMVDNVTYRRVMDWDVPPTEFDEFVTIGGWPATALLHTGDNGFATANPLDPFGAYLTDIGLCGLDANFTKCGPDDHGALFDFDFGSLADGESVTFSIFYGAAFGESAILSALGTVGAEVYSLGYSTSAAGGADTDSVVYAFGFKGVGGTPIVPEPGTLVLLGSGILALVARRRRSS